tara:strand:- start:1997 stop:2959 length:963 start_codon:yes stop_codon:yes gene_type:complete
MNILITSAGRRVSLVESFKKSVIENKLNSKVMTTDLDPNKSPAAFFSDQSFKTCKFSNPNYNSQLLKICMENQIKLLIPTLDTELLNLANNYDEFLDKEIQIVISDKKLIQIFSNKILTQSFFRKLNIKTPKTYKTNDLSFPIFIKPISGSNSNGTYVAFNNGQLKQSDINSNEIMLSQYIDPRIYEEYTVDMYYNKNSKLICSVPRIRLKVVGGESNQGITKKNEVLNFIKNNFQNLKGARGCITLQLFSKKENQSEIYCIEVNPRFGGGYPFSYNSGANFPDLIIKEYILNQNLKYIENWKKDCLSIRYEKEIIKHEE